MLDLLIFLSNIAIGVATLVAILFIIAFKKLSKSLKLLAIYFIVSAIVDLLSILPAFSNNNLFISHIFSIFEFVILTILFRYLYKKLGAKIELLYVLIPGIILFILNSIYIQSLTSYASITSAISSGIIVIYCIYYFYLTMDLKTYVHTKWIIAILFIYHTTLIIVNLFSNKLIEMNFEASQLVWIVRISIILILKILLLYQVILIYKEKKLIPFK